MKIFGFGEFVFEMLERLPAPSNDTRLSSLYEVKTNWYQQLYKNQKQKSSCHRSPEGSSTLTWTVFLNFLALYFYFICAFVLLSVYLGGSTGLITGLPSALIESFTEHHTQAGDWLLFHLTVALNVSKPSGAAGGEKCCLLKMPILIGKYLLAGALGRHTHDF